MEHDAFRQAPVCARGSLMDPREYVLDGIGHTDALPMLCGEIEEL